ncbi:hypothetical protein [Polaribacter sp.]|uniref:hypothetical protein n=1 Tax=Polaribacter sp. TaxID=1920175 RepID=UPI003F698960
MKKQKIIMAFFIHFFSIVGISKNTLKIYLLREGANQTVTSDFKCSEGMNFGSCSKIEVPSCWVQQELRIYNYGIDRKRINEMVTYKFYFHVPKSLRGKRKLILS